LIFLLKEILNAYGGFKKVLKMMLMHEYFPFLDILKNITLKNTSFKNR